jgi:hypothetical protein
MTWSDAKAYCQSQYSDLASIHSQASNDYVRQLCQQQLQTLGGVQGGHSSCWIGANDKGTEGTEVWSDGTEIDYDDWYPGEPNNVQNTVVNGITKDEDVTEFRVWCNPTDECCASRTCPVSAAPSHACSLAMVHVVSCLLSPVSCLLSLYQLYMHATPVPNLSARCITAGLERQSGRPPLPVHLRGARAPARWWPLSKASQQPAAAWGGGGGGRRKKMWADCGCTNALAL